MEKGEDASSNRPSSSLGGRVHRKAPPPSNHSDTKVDDSLTPEMSASLKKALSSIANICPPAPTPSTSSGPPEGAPGSPPFTTPSLRIQRPTVRISNKKPPLNTARSTENLLGGSPLRPSSRSGGRTGIRPPSRSGMLLKKKSSDLLLSGKHGAGMRLSRSHQPSPAHRFGTESEHTHTTYPDVSMYAVLKIPFPKANHKSATSWCTRPIP